MSFRDSDQLAAIAGAEESIPKWYVGYTRPRMEETALQNLQRQGFHTYLPLFKTTCRTPDGLQPVHVPMFTRYLFVRPATESQSLSSVASTRGMVGLVRFGSELAVVLPEVVQKIRDFERSRNAASLDAISPIQPGARVRMRKGALKGLEGLVVSVAKHRVTFLLHLLGQEKPVTVGHAELELT